MLIASQEGFRKLLLVPTDNGYFDYIKNNEGVKIFWNSVHDHEVSEPIALYETEEQAMDMLNVILMAIEQDEKTFKLPTVKQMKEAQRMTSDHVEDVLRKIFS